MHPIWLVTGLLHIDAGGSYSLLLGLWQAAGLILLVIVLRHSPSSCSVPTDGPGGSR